MLAFKLTVLLAIVLPEANSIEPVCESKCVPNETKEGEGVEFTCTASSGGDSALELTWNLSPIESEYPEVQNLDDGDIFKRGFTWNVVAPVPLLVCSALDSNGEVETCQTTQCDILYSPRNVKTSLQYSVSPGENITCTADGNPPPTLTWQQSDGYGTWTDVEGANGETITAELKDGATDTELRCVATNSVSSENSDMVFVSNYDDSTIGTVIIVCVAVGVPVVGVISGVIYYKVKGGGG